MQQNKGRGHANQQDGYLCQRLLTKRAILSAVALPFLFHTSSTFLASSSSPTPWSRLVQSGYRTDQGFVGTVLCLGGRLVTKIMYQDQPRIESSRCVESSRRAMRIGLALRFVLVVVVAAACPHDASIRSVGERIYPLVLLLCIGISMRLMILS